MLTEFRVSGYKSLYDCTIPGLLPINVFHGDNNVGKSNILEALGIFFTGLASGEKGPDGPHDEWFSWGEREKEIVLTGIFRQDGQEHQARVTIRHEEGSDYVKSDVPNSLNLNRVTCYRVPSRRRLEVEEDKKAEEDLQPEGANLKEQLFWASVSKDPANRKAFYEVLRPLFAESPLALGTLQPVAAPEGPYDVQIESESRSIPLEQMGSGVQQLVLMAGLIALSRADVIAIEEPEMNLSWPTQKKLRLIFKEMVKRREAPPTQMFISSHSPLFEFYENFYRVEMIDGRTKVTKVANEERRRLFDTLLPPSDRRAAWLHDENVVILPEYVVETLGVRQGEIVYFLPEERHVRMLNEQDFADLTRPEEAS
jgi:predicted ATPase